MENLDITFISTLVLIILVLVIFKPYRCPFCKSPMDDVYDEETGESWKVCPTCGKRILVGKEEDDG